MKRIIGLMIACLLLFTSGRGQIRAEMGGYLSDMQSVLFEDIEGQWMIDNLIHNRINLNASAGSHLKAALEFRNRFFFGETVKYVPDYDQLLDADRGWLDLSFNLIADSSYIINTAIDRMYLDYSHGKFQATIGRQRINWGMNFVWNPNDLFNSYSFFDFDYPERPGSDALRIQYYLSNTSSLELVSKINQEEQWSLAGLFRFNIFGYDVQFLGGILNEKEYVMGLGYSGNLGPVSLSGEYTYLKPKLETGDTQAALISGFGISYNTPFNLFIQAEYLYNQAAKQSNIKSFSDFYYRNMDIRDLSMAAQTYFISLTYPANPLWRLGISGMFFPGIEGVFLGPTTELSLRDDLDLSFFVQYFKINLASIDQKATLGFLRLKWSF